MKKNLKYIGSIIALLFICAAFMINVVIFIGVIFSVLVNVRLSEYSHAICSASELLVYFITSVGGLLSTILYFRRLNEAL